MPGRTCEPFNASDILPVSSIHPCEFPQPTIINPFHIIATITIRTFPSQPDLA